MYLSDFHKVLITFFVLAFLPMEAWSNKFNVDFKSLEIQMRAEVRVSNERILLGDVATIYAKNRADFNLLSEIEIVRMPSERKYFQVPYDYLVNRIREALGAEKEFHLSAPKEVRFLREQFGVSATEIANEIWRTGKLNGAIPEGVEIEVVPISGFEGIAKIPFGEFKIAPMSANRSYKGDTEFTISSGESRAAISKKLRVSIKWFANALVARRKIKFLEDLRTDDFAWQRIEVTDLPQDVIFSAKEEMARARVRGSRAKRVIAENAVLQISQLDKRADANAGQALKVVFVSESGLKVSAEGSLVAPGILGETTRARLKASRKVVSGRLVSEGVMEVSL